MSPNPVVGSLLSDRVKRGDYYFLDLTPDAGKDLVVVCGGREVCDQTYVVDRPGFRYHSLEFVASGTGTLTLAGRRFRLVPGTVFSYGPQVPHRIEVGESTAMVKYFVDVVGTDAPALAQAACPQGQPWAVSGTAWIQRLFEDLKVAADTLQGTRTRVCELIVRQLLTLLADSSLSVSPQETQLRQKFQHCRAVLKEQALQGTPLDVLASSCGVSTSYLSRLFRRFERVTPHRYLVQCRMAFAASLLLDPTLLVREVASLAGYDDPYHFSRTFKDVYGCSPESFRRLRS